VIIKSARLNTTRERRDIPFALTDLKFASSKNAEDPVTFEGYGSVWDRVDAYGDTVMKGAFTDSLKTRMPMMFFGHNPGRVPGKWTSAVEDSKGLKLKGELTPGHSEAMDLAASLRHGSLSGLSIGGYTTKSQLREENGQPVGRDIHAFDLWEVSPVSMPAETEARIDGQSIKSILDECESIKDMEDLLREVAGFSKTTATAFVARCRRISRGEPGGQASAELKDLLATVTGASIPTSLLGD
jgi:HK97 family phage prohead protease